jgi:sensor histidine kinase YesM
MYELYWIPIDFYGHLADVHLYFGEVAVDYLICAAISAVNLALFHYYFHKRLFLKSGHRMTWLLLFGMLCINLLIAYLITFVENHLYNRMLGADEFTLTDDLLNTYGLGVFATLVSVMYLFFHYIGEYKDFMRQREQEIKAAAETHIAALQSQMAPHFLFNCLSVAIGLVETSPEKASDYLAHLAALYREGLRNKDKTCIPLKEELQNLSKYMQLMEIRFGEALCLKVDASAEETSESIFPGALMVVMENVVKHNSLSLETPMQVDIRVEGGQVVIWNDYRPIPSSAESFGLGVQNIRQRYESIGMEGVEFSHDAQKYTVKLPLIHPV